MADSTTHDVGLVVFDCDGVLVDSERLTVAVEAQMLTEEFDRRSIVAAFHAELQPVDGVRESVAALHLHRVLTCVASSGTHRKMDLTLGLTGMRHLFDGRIHSASEVERGKPWPDLFLHAARAMGVDPSRCVVIEDSINGARAAISAGMICYGFAGGLSQRTELEASGATVFDTMDELRDILLAGG